MKHPPGKAFLRVRPSMVMLEADAAMPAGAHAVQDATASGTAMTTITAAATAATPASEVAGTTGNRLLRTWCRPDAGKGQMNRIINRCRLS